MLVVGMVSACHRLEWGQYRGILECHENDASVPLFESSGLVRVITSVPVVFFCFDDLPCIGAEDVLV